MVHEEAFTTDASGKVVLTVPLKAGIYRAELESRDAFDKPVKAMLQLQVLDMRC